ncbi:STAS domain-containing protein [Marinitenerispora sediminis]|uniref:Anti-sigma factor antagonist n=1 Tax=Marinitenerispora sediminis TaxID=1931232 RepID=A0A368T1T3_9ACTN|nr:STAS domain-containing protein [Marinitenerispora sediminis]RCV49290.1 anti-sigma factor antagonist [Marinitenerispora sediminis]RCV50546.1 anti-sigma factor antagonist [Marinitenerispora sediminis]RCV54794.1 anti-sigma factor antagonist [Marinitenerispora sediminis]
MPALNITARNHDDGTVLVLDGEIDIANEDDFHHAVLEAVSERPHGRVVLDCSRLSFIDSSGLRVLIQCHKASRDHYSRILIAAASERVAQILHVTALDTRIPVHPTVESALEAPLESASQN